MYEAFPGLAKRSALADAAQHVVNYLTVLVVALPRPDRRARHCRSLG